MRIAKGDSVHFETSLCPLPLINIGVLDTVRVGVGGLASNICLLCAHTDFVGLAADADAALLLLLLSLLLFQTQDWYEGITRKLKWNQSIRGVPGTAGAGLEAAILHTAATAASSAHVAELQPQLSLGGLVSDLTAAAHNEAKVANWVEEALTD
jgi:hypothetical protein